MGGFYGSVQLRCEDRAKVLAASEAVAREMNVKCLVGPPLNGWVGVYPEGNGQDHTVGQRIAAAVGGHGLHLLVHDDDVLAYWLWHDGQLVDRYWSAPGYFGEANRAEEEPLVGDADRFAFVLDEAGRAKFAKLVDRSSEATFEIERLRKLGRLLGIENGHLSYEGLSEPGGPRVKGRRQFTELPLDEAAAKRAAVPTAGKLLRGERNRLKSAGLLLAHFERGQLLGGAAAIVGGFLRFPSPWYYENPPSLEFHSPPWAKPTAVGFDLPPRSNPFNVVASASGRRVAAQADHAIRIWEWDGSAARHLSDVATPQFAGVLAISGDGNMVAETVQAGDNSNHELAIHDARAQPRVSKIGLKRIHQTAFSPDGRVLAVAAETVEWIELAEDGRQRSFAAGEFAPSRPAANKAERSRSHEHVHCVGFSRDGRWFWTGSNHGVCVFEAKAFDAGGTVTPRPNWTAGPPVWEGKECGFVYSVAELFGTDAIVFAGGGPNVMRLDLSTGAVRPLAQVPGAEYVTALAISTDGRYLAISSNTNRAGVRKIDCWFQVWDVERLLG
jgi:hypothetical protein